MQTLRRTPYHRPGTLAEALRLKRADPDARFVAGGTDLLLRLADGRLRAGALISLRAIGELSGLALEGAALRIGALTCLTDVLEDPLVGRRYPVLVQAVRRMACEQIRNSATIGGNLCNASPCADTAPPLLVLGARARMRGPGGRREVALEDFFVGPGETCLQADELLEAILVDPPAAGARAAFHKLGRVRVDVSLATVAVLVELDGARCRRARVAAGAVAPLPLRLIPVEDLLEGELLTPELLARAQELAAGSVAPITDVRASEEHRRHVVGVFVRRALEGLCAEESA